MDILDIMLARAMTPQGKTEAYAARAGKAAQDALKARDDADAAIASVTAAAQDIADTKSAAESALHDAQDALAAAQAAQLNIPTLYNSTGQNTDGTMTQKAITDTLATKADASALASKADKTYVDEQIAAIPSGGGGSTVVNLDAADAGHLVAIDENGHLIASGTTENAIIEAMLQ